MGILNVTPDSFSDGGRFLSIEDAVRRAAAMIEQGVDIIDVGGESTRPGSARIDADTEKERTVPLVEAITKQFDVPISIDTSKLSVAKAAIDAGAEIVNDISGLRWDERIGALAASTRVGLVLMHSRGDFENMHNQPPVDDIFEDITMGLRTSLEVARKCEVADDQIVLDIGMGFGKSPEQNLELIAKLDKIVSAFDSFPLLVGASRKSFIGKLLEDAPADQRLHGSIAAAVLAVFNGAKVLRVHDIAETVEAVQIATAARKQRSL